MPRFTATISGGMFTVVDTAPMSPVTVLSMSASALHGPGGGGGGVQITPTISVAEIDRAFGTPYGIEREMGFDLHFDFDNSGGGGAKEIGSFFLDNIALDSPIAVENTYKPLAPESLSGTQFRSRFYPQGTYSPLVIARGDTNYNICAAMCYDVLGFNHILYIEYGIDGSGTSVLFEASDHAGSPMWFTIPAGEKRRYTVMFRINDRTDTPIGSATDAAEEWLWTVRGYQTFFRRRFGKPNYRRMGGWNGRPIGAMNSSPGTYDAMTNPRRYGNSVAANPTTNGANPGDPDGFFKFAAQAETIRGRNLPRILIWALSGQHDPPPPNYDFRFATQVATLDTVGDGVGPATVQPGLRHIRDRMQLGLYWGRSLAVDDSTDWDVSTPEQLDLTDPALVTTAVAEMDLAVNRWGAQLIGLDEFDTKLTPALGPAWLRLLQGRYPHAMLLTEQALPDYLHVIAPTFIWEGSSYGAVDRPFWLQQYLNPGCECILQITGVPSGVSQQARADALVQYGFAPIALWGETLTQSARAVARWVELGESAIPSHRESTNRIAIPGVWP